MYLFFWLGLCPTTKARNEARLASKSNAGSAVPFATCPVHHLGLGWPSYKMDLSLKTLRGMFWNVSMGGWQRKWSWVWVGTGGCWLGLQIRIQSHERPLTCIMAHTQDWSGCNLVARECQQVTAGRAAPGGRVKGHLGSCSR